MLENNSSTLPGCGHRVMLRGTTFFGKLLDYNPANDWAYVAWESILDRPESNVCHWHELERK